VGRNRAEAIAALPQRTSGFAHEQARERTRPAAASCAADLRFHLGARACTTHAAKPILGRLLFAVIGLLGLGLVAGGIFQIHNKESGTRVKATVLSCVNAGGIHSTDQCTATWISGGSLVGGNGHVVEGPIDDANSDDIGKTLEVRAAHPG
jgi:hypothetical protein